MLRFEGRVQVFKFDLALRIGDGSFQIRRQLCLIRNRFDDRGAAIFELAQRYFEAEPEQIVFIDDYPSNIAAARAAGWQAIHFTSAAQCEAALAERGLL